MKANRLTVITAACGLSAFVGLSPAQASVATAAPILQAGLNQSIVDGYPGAIAMIRDAGQTQYLHAGVGSRDTNAPADPAAKFRIGSNTKSFTAATVLLLEAAGLLSLDDTVDHWLPGLINRNGFDGTKINLRQVLNHTSGLPDYNMSATGFMGSSTWTPTQLINGALNKAPLGQPGQVWGYTNTNYVLAGMVIKAVTGNDPAVEMQQRIFTPLGLTNTSLPAGNTMTGNYLRGYFISGPFIWDYTTQSVQATWTAGAIVSTLADLGTFERALIGGTLLPPQQEAEFKTTVPTGHAGVEYGLGMQRAQTPCGPVWTHGGLVPGYNSYHITSDDGVKQLVQVNTEYHLIPHTDGQDHTAASAVNTYCAL
jgi:D-alanyl-D-alanine carboxypeptidase